MQDEFGETALHAASIEGHVEVMTILVQRGANVNSLNKVCKSILYQHVCLNFSRLHACMCMVWMVLHRCCWLHMDCVCFLEFKIPIVLKQRKTLRNAYFQLFPRLTCLS